MERRSNSGSPEYNPHLLATGLFAVALGLWFYLLIAGLWIIIK